MGFVRAAARRGEIRKRHGIEIVVGEQDESEAASSERYDFADHVIDATLSRLLPVGAPHRAKRAMLRTAADRLHRSPHVFVGGQQIPSRGDERAAFDSPAVIKRLERPRDVVVEHGRPDHVAVTLDYGMGRAVFPCLVGIESGMNAPEDDRRAALAGDTSELISPQGVGGVNANPHDITRRDTVRVKRFERLIDDHRRPIVRWRRCGQHVQPTRCDDGGPERYVRRIDDVYAHWCGTLSEDARDRLANSRKESRRSDCGLSANDSQPLPLPGRPRPREWHSSTILPATTASVGAGTISLETGVPGNSSGSYLALARRARSDVLGLLVSLTLREDGHCCSRLRARRSALRSTFGSSLRRSPKPWRHGVVAMRVDRSAARAGTTRSESRRPMRRRSSGPTSPRPGHPGCHVTSPRAPRSQRSAPAQPGRARRASADRTSAWSTCCGVDRAAGRLALSAAKPRAPPGPAPNVTVGPAGRRVWSGRPQGPWPTRSLARPSRRRRSRARDAADDRSTRPRDEGRRRRR